MDQAQAGKLLVERNDSGHVNADLLQAFAAFEHLADGAVYHRLPVFQHQQLFRVSAQKPDFLLHRDDRGTGLPVQLRQQAVDLFAALGIQFPGGFIQDDNPGAERQNRSNRNLLSDSCKDPWNRTFDATNWIYDFLRGVEDKGDTNIASLYKGQSGKIMLGALGRGHNGYILEPQTANPMGYNKDLKADFDNDHMAPYEVTVTVTIKLKSMANPIVMSRVYLPEFEWVDVNTPSNMASLYNRIKNGKKSNSTELYDYQVKRIGEILKWINPKFNY